MDYWPGRRKSEAGERSSRGAGIGDMERSRPVGNRRERGRSGESEEQDRKCREGKEEIAAS